MEGEETVEVAEAAPVEAAPEPVEAAPEPVAAAPEPVSAPVPEFDWDSWDGKVDALPEQHRDIGGRFHSYYDNQLAQLRSQKEELQEWIDLVSSGEMPDLKEAKSEIARLKAEMEASVKDYETMAADYEVARQAWEAHQQEEDARYTAWFKNQYPEFWSDAEKGKQLAELLEEDWDAEVAATLLRRGDQAVEYAREAKAKGASDQIAFDMAMLKLDAGKPRPSKSSSFVSGSTPAARGDISNVRDLNDARSRKELREIAAENALKRHMKR